MRQAIPVQAKADGLRRDADGAAAGLSAGPAARVQSSSQRPVRLLAPHRMLGLPSLSSTRLCEIATRSSNIRHAQPRMVGRQAKAVAGKKMALPVIVTKRAIVIVSFAFYMRFAY